MHGGRGAIHVGSKGDSRTRPNRPGCPGCAGYVPTDANNLLKWCQDNGEYGQKLIEEWAEPDVDMKDVTPATKKKLTCGGARRDARWTESLSRGRQR